MTISSGSLDRRIPQQGFWEFCLEYSQEAITKAEEIIEVHENKESPDLALLQILRTRLNILRNLLTEMKGHSANWADCDAQKEAYHQLYWAIHKINGTQIYTIILPQKSSLLGLVTAYQKSQSVEVALRETGARVYKGDIGGEPIKYEPPVDATT